MISWQGFTFSFATINFFQSGNGGSKAQLYFFYFCVEYCHQLNSCLHRSTDIMRQLACSLWIGILYRQLVQGTQCQTLFIICAARPNFAPVAEATQGTRLGLSQHG